MIEINNCVKQIELNFKPKIIFELILKTTNEFLNIDNKRLIVVNLVDSKEIQLINKQYRNKNNITDVISFSFDESGVKGPIIGEIYICLEQAILQANEYLHSYKREIAFLFTHGLLHLYGFDHQTEEESEKMFNEQKKILNKCNIIRSI